MVLRYCPICDKFQFEENMTKTIWYTEFNCKSNIPEVVSSSLVGKIGEPVCDTCYKRDDILEKIQDHLLRTTGEFYNLEQLKKLNQH